MSEPISSPFCYDVVMDMFEDVHMKPSQNIIHRYGDMLLCVFFLKECTFSIQEGLREESKILHSGKVSAFETILPIQGKYPLPLSGFNYNPGCLPMCFVTDQPDSAFFIFGICPEREHKYIAKSTKWLGVDNEVLYNNDCVKDECTILRLVTKGVNEI